jgi:hypothetical protein
MDADDEFGLDDELTAEDLRHFDELEGAAYASMFNFDLILTCI